MSVLHIYAFSQFADLYLNKMTMDLKKFILIQANPLSSHINMTSTKSSKGTKKMLEKKKIF